MKSQVDPRPKDHVIMATNGFYFGKIVVSTMGILSVYFLQKYVTLPLTYMIESLCKSILFHIFIVFDVARQ